MCRVVLQTPRARHAPRLVADILARISRGCYEVNCFRGISAVCIDGVGCERWKSCCRAANTCCRRQLSLTTRPASAMLDPTRVDDADERCASTWDGFSCWDSANPGTTVRQACPAYMDRVITTRQYCRPTAVLLIGPIPWGHSGPLCHALSLSSSSLSLWTSMRRRRATVQWRHLVNWREAAHCGEWAQHFSNASCFNF